MPVDARERALAGDVGRHGKRVAQARGGVGDRRGDRLLLRALLLHRVGPVAGDGENRQRDDRDYGAIFARHGAEHNSCPATSFGSSGEAFQ
jgi:hypothetical protein